MKQLVLIAIAGVLLISCSKEKSFESSSAGQIGDTTTMYITAKINGVLTAFNVNDVGKLTDFGSGLSSLSITGSASADPSDAQAMNLSINFFNVTPSVGTYTQDSTNTSYMTAGVYNPNSTTIVYTAGVTSSSLTPLSITITKLNNNQVEGTFQGAFYKTDISSGSPTTDYVTITNGSFRVPIQ